MSEAARMAADIISGKRPVIRNLRPGETLPARFEVGFDQLNQLDPEWVWVMERGTIEGCLVASPCHGTAIVWRLFCENRWWLLALLRRFAKDIRKRGCKGYMMLLDTSKPTQAKLARLVKHQGGGTLPFQFSLHAAPLRERLV